MNAQEIFDKVARHLLTQKEQSRDSFSCAYRGVNQNGKILSCAVGCLIPDDKVPMFNGLNHALEAVPELKKHEKLLEDLMTTHDGIDCGIIYAKWNIESWFDTLATVGCAHDLDISVLNEFDSEE